MAGLAMRYARLNVSLGRAKHIALVSRGRASFARGCSWLLMASHGCSRLLEAARGCSKLLEASRRPAPTRPKSLGRVSAPPRSFSALRGLARGQDLLRAAGGDALPGKTASLGHTSPQPSRHVRRKGAALLSGTEEQTARAISAHAQYACLLSLQMGSIN